MVDTTLLLDTLLPVDLSVVEEVLINLTSCGEYDAVRCRWAQFPEKTVKDGVTRAPKEKELYMYFTRVANKIIDEAMRVIERKEGKAFVCDDEGRTVLSDRWIDCSTRSPESANEAIWRPEDKITAVWWMQVIAIVEAKGTEWRPFASQLFAHLHQLLVEQPNRRHVFGLTLELTQISIWMLDYLGGVSTDAPINFHMDPKRLIQSIMALRMLPANMLGFDDDMRLYRGPRQLPLPPYRMPIRRTLSPSTLRNERPDVTEGLREASKLEPFLHDECDNRLYIARFIEDRQPDQIADRVCTRILLSTYDTPLYFFAKRIELVSALLDALKGDKHLYLNGVLPCDISPGNILVRLLEAGKPVQGTRGCLIDLDHGKQETNRSTEPLPNKMRMSCISEDMLPYSIADVQDLVHQRTQGRYSSKATLLKGATVDRSVCERALHAMACRFDEDGDAVLGAMKYVLAAAAHVADTREAPPGPYTAATLHWENVNPEPNSRSFSRSASDSESSDEQAWSRSGTLPYISVELLGPVPSVVVKTPLPVEESVRQDAVHDIESFFWVLLYICITREGPGNRIRPELSRVGRSTSRVNRSADQASSQKSLLTICYCFFDGDRDTLFANKSKLFQSIGMGDFENHVLKYFTTYFESFKDALRRYFQLLRLAYEFRAYEYNDIHNRAIAILEELLVKLQSPRYREDDTPARKKALEERQDQINCLRGSIGKPDGPALSGAATSPMMDSRDTSRRSEQSENATDTQSATQTSASVAPAAVQTRMRNMKM